MASVRDYFTGCSKVTDPSHVRVRNLDIGDIEPCFDDIEIQSILSLNRQFMDEHIPKWLDSRSELEYISTERVHVTRGFYLKEHFQQKEYLEWSYLNSYTIAFSISEQFSKMSNDEIPAILSTNIANVRNRILYFTPFIKGVNPNQFELVVIPHYWTAYMQYQGNFSGINEYYID